MGDNFVSRILWCLSVWFLSAALVRAFQPDRTMLRQMFEESLRRRTREFGRNDSHTAQASRDLGLFLQRNGDAAGARRTLTDTVAIDEAVFGRSAPQTLEDVSALAAVSPPALAGPLLLRAAESPDAAVAGPALSSLAERRIAAGDRAGAAAYLRRALEKAESVEGKDGPIVALILNELALNVDAKQGVPYLERALQIDRAKLGERDTATILTEVNLARLLLGAGRVDDAVAAGRTALGASEAAFGAGHPGTADALAALARAMLAKGDKAQAERLYRQALALLRQSGRMGEAAALERAFTPPPGR